MAVLRQQFVLIESPNRAESFQVQHHPVSLSAFCNYRRDIKQNLLWSMACLPICYLFYSLCGITFVLIFSRDSVFHFDIAVVPLHITKA